MSLGSLGGIPMGFGKNLNSYWCMPIVSSVSVSLSVEGPCSSRLIPRKSRIGSSYFVGFFLFFSVSVNDMVSGLWLRLSETFEFLIFCCVFGSSL